MKYPSPQMPRKSLIVEAIDQLILYLLCNKLHTYCYTLITAILAKYGTVILALPVPRRSYLLELILTQNCPIQVTDSTLWLANILGAITHQGHPQEMMLRPRGTLAGPRRPREAEDACQEMCIEINSDG